MMSVRFEPRHGLILVKAELWGPTGSTILRMALDTGAMTTLVNAEPLVAVGYDPAASQDRVELTTGSAIEIASEIMIERICALDQERANYSVVCHTLPPSAHVDGLLGLDFLRGQVLQIDFRGGEITLG